MQKEKKVISEFLEELYFDFIEVCKAKKIKLENSFLRKKQTDKNLKFQEFKNIVTKLNISDLKYIGENFEYTTYGLLKLTISLELLALGVRSQKIQAILSEFDNIIKDSNKPFISDFNILQIFIGIEVNLYISDKGVQLQNNIEYTNLGNNNTSTIIICLNKLLKKFYKNIPPIKIKNTLDTLGKNTISLIVGITEKEEFNILTEGLLAQYDFMGNLTVKATSKDLEMKNFNKIDKNFEHGNITVNKNNGIKKNIELTHKFDLNKIKKSLKYK